MAVSNNILNNPADYFHSTSTESTLYCRASFGTFEAGRAFYLAACAMCYMYTFREPQRKLRSTDYPLSVSRDLQHLDDADENVNNRTYSFLADADDRLSPVYTHGFPAESAAYEPAGQIWRSCCSAARRCCDQHAFAKPNRLLLAAAVESEIMCPATWDGWSCWPSTSPNTTIHGACPAYMAPNDEPCSGWSQKTCLDGGQWLKGTNSSRERTDYSQCEFAKTMLKNQYWWAMHISYCLSIVSLIPALLIFLCIRQLRSSTRIRLHICLLLTLLFTAVLGLWNQQKVVYAADVDKSYDSLAPHTTTTTTTGEHAPHAITFEIVLCRLGFVLFQYLRLSCLAWTLCEAVRLTRVIASSLVVACQAEDESLVPYIIVGWMLPVIPILIFFLLKYSNEQQSQFSLNGKGQTAPFDRCWINPEGDNFWILTGPSLLILLLSACCLGRIMLEVIRKLQATQTNELTQFGKTARATIILSFIFAHYFLATVFRPETTCRSAGYLIANEYVIGLQGLIVSMVLCYLNGEVNSLVRVRLRAIWRDWIANRRCLTICFGRRGRMHRNSRSSSTTTGSSNDRTPARFTFGGFGGRGSRQLRAQSLSLPKTTLYHTNGATNGTLCAMANSRNGSTNTDDATEQELFSLIAASRTREHPHQRSASYCPSTEVHYSNRNQDLMAEEDNDGRQSLSNTDEQSKAGRV